MFKLLAIRPLEGCAEYIQKCLKTGMMYYFCNDYIIEPGSHIRRRSKNIKPLKEDFFSIPVAINGFNDNSSKENTPTISVSAIVGKNGDGKSTLVELMIRLINNCAIAYNMCASVDNLRRVKDVKAELYYMIDNVVYRMAEEKDDEKDDGTQIWKVAELKPLDEKGEEFMRWEIDPKLVNRVDDDPKCFFFTIVSNYSHYAYNIHDFKDEWEVRGEEKDDDEKCWLHYLFHKNDGYLTPITLHPYRYKGNININVEKDLSKQRLLSLLLNADNPSDNPLSFRRVNEKDANLLRLTEETESKLQQKAIIEYFKTTNQEDRFEMLHEEIDGVDERIDQAVSVFDLDFGFVNDYEKLVEIILPSYFVKPINQIIEQDATFNVFANEVVNWLITTNNVHLQGDIGSVVEHYEILMEKIKNCAEIITNNRIARVYIKTGDFNIALNYSQRALKTSRSKLSMEHPLTAASYNNIGLVHYNQGEYKKAMENFFKALEIVEKSPEKYPLTATIYNNIGLVYCNQSDYDIALEHFFKALKYRESVIDKKYPNTATIYNNTETAKIYDNIGVVYYNRGDYNNALNCYSKALAIRENVLGEEHPDTATTYNGIGLMYYNLSDYTKALDCYLKALAIREKALGREHPDTISSYNNIGFVYWKQGDYDQALKYYMNAMEIREKVLGTEHPDTATSYSSIALVCFAKCNYDKALEYLYKSMAIREMNMDATRPNTYTIALMYEDKDDYDKMLNYLHKASDFYEKTLRETKLGEDNLNATTTLNNIARVYDILGKYDQALYYYNKALDIREKELGANHPDTATTYKDIARVYKRVYKYKDNVGKAYKYYNMFNTIQLPKTKDHNENVRSEKVGIDTSLVGKDKIHKEMEEIKKEKREIINMLNSHEWLFNPKQKFLNVINAAQLGRLDTIFRILKFCNYDWKMVTKNHSELSLEEKCHHFIVYKLWSILSTYSQYQNAYDSIESIREFGSAMEDYIKEIKNESKSYNTRELRQVYHFIQEGNVKEGGLYRQLGKTEEEDLLVNIDKLKEHYGEEAFSLDNLPPPIYKWDILFKKKGDPNCVIEFDSFSSGEKQMLNSVSAIIYYLQDLANTSSEVKYNNVNLIMEEIELYYHPEYQRLFFSQLLDMIQRAKLENIQNINIVFVTHSPFILSDIPKCNVLFLREGMPDDELQENTFGANIHSLLKHGFFMPNLPIGEFAYGKINALFKKLNSGELNPEKDLGDIYQEILLVGEPFLRNQLLQLYNSYKGSRLIPNDTNDK